MGLACKAVGRAGATAATGCALLGPPRTHEALNLGRGYMEGLGVRRWQEGRKVGWCHDSTHCKVGWCHDSTHCKVGWCLLNECGCQSEHKLSTRVDRHCSEGGLQ